MMKLVDWLVLGILVVIAAAAVYAIYRSKKSGKKCIGCPDSGSCSGCCANCNAHNDTYRFSASS